MRFVQPLTEMSIKADINVVWSRVRPVRNPYKFTAICVPIVYTMWGSLTSYNRMGLHGMLQE
jgi:hypothetical protein